MKYRLNYLLEKKNTGSFKKHTSVCKKQVTEDQAEWLSEESFLWNSECLQVFVLKHDSMTRLGMENSVHWNWFIHSTSLKYLAKQELLVWI